MPKVNVYLPDDLADAVKDAQLPVSAICQAALEKAVRDVTSMRGTDEPPPTGGPGFGLFGRFTDRARKALALAQQCARDMPHDFVGTEHILIGVIDEGSNLALKVLTSLDVDPGDLRAELLGSMSKRGRRVDGQLPFTPLAKRALETTTTEAHSLGHNYIGCEHLLLGLLATEDGIASQVLRRMGVELRTTRRAVVAALVGYVQARENPPRSQAGIDEVLRRLDAIERRLGEQN